MTPTERDGVILKAWAEGDDETFMREIALANLEGLWRPRDEFDQWNVPGSLRDEALKIMEAFEAMPWWLRALSRVMAAWMPWRRRGVGE